MTSKSAPLGIRHVERPRPLRSVSHIGIPNAGNMGNASGANRRLSAQDVSEVEEVLHLLEHVSSSLSKKSFDKSVTNSIIRLNCLLKSHGAQVELFHRDLMDKAQVVLRNASKDSNLNILARLNLLELIELRSMKWILNDSVINYYKQKKAMVEGSHDDDPPGGNFSRKSLNVNAPLFTPQQNFPGSSGNILDQLLPNQNASSVIPGGEVIMPSGKYTGPTQPHGKSYFKDEIFIRNADSGKVMGVKGRRIHMIEEMSDTTISFQRVMPGTVDRLVQITGSIPSNVSHAKSLMEDTIRRNQSPLPDFMGDNSGSVETPPTGTQPETQPENDYKFSVKVGEEIIKISSSSLSLVKSAKIVLEEYFCNSHAIRSMVSVARQPLFPDSTPEAVEIAEALDGGGHSQLRRDNFAKTKNVKMNQKNNNSYDREFLLECAQAPICNKPPLNWDQISVEFPDIVRKDKNPISWKQYASIPLTTLIPTLTLSQKHQHRESAVIDEE